MEAALSRIAKAHRPFKFDITCPFRTHICKEARPNSRDSISFNISSESVTDFCRQLSAELKSVPRTSPHHESHAPPMARPRILITKASSEEEAGRVLDLATSRYKEGTRSATVIGLTLRVFPYRKDYNKHSKTSIPKFDIDFLFSRKIENQISDGETATPTHRLISPSLHPDIVRRVVI